LNSDFILNSTHCALCIDYNELIITNKSCFNLTRALKENNLEWEDILSNQKENKNKYTEGAFNGKIFPYIPEEAFKVNYTDLNIQFKEVNNNNNITLEWSIETFLQNQERFKK
jgi:hypothetical protein